MGARKAKEKEQEERDKKNRQQELKTKQLKHHMALWDALKCSKGKSK